MVQVDCLHYLVIHEGNCDSTHQFWPLDLKKHIKRDELTMKSRIGRWEERRDSITPQVSLHSTDIKLHYSQDLCIIMLHGQGGAPSTVSAQTTFPGRPVFPATSYDKLQIFSLQVVKMLHRLQTPPLPLDQAVFLSPGGRSLLMEL